MWGLASKMFCDTGALIAGAECWVLLLQGLCGYEREHDRHLGELCRRWPHVECTCPRPGSHHTSPSEHMALLATVEPVKRHHESASMQCPAPGPQMSDLHMSKHSIEPAVPIFR